MYRFAADVKGPVLHRAVVADERRTGFGPGHLVHWRLPGPLGNLGVGGGQVGPRDVEIQDGLTVGFVFGMQEGERFGFVLRAQVDLFARGRVLAVVNAGSAEQDESLFENLVP